MYKRQVDLRYNAPDSDADQRLIADGDGVVEIDLRELRQLEPDWQAYGAALNQAVFAGAVGRAFSDARNNAQSRDAILRVRLVIEPSAPELHSVHWEKMCIRDSPIAPRHAEFRHIRQSTTFGSNRQGKWLIFNSYKAVTGRAISMCAGSTS